VRGVFEGVGSGEVMLWIGFGVLGIAIKIEPFRLVSAH
jgi:hypothetical protein